MSEEIRETVRRLSAEPNLADARRLVRLLERSDHRESPESSLVDLAAVLESRGGRRSRANLVRLCNAISRSSSLRYGDGSMRAMTIGGDRLGIASRPVRDRTAGWLAAAIDEDTLRAAHNCGEKTVAYARELLALAGLELVRSIDPDSAFVAGRVARYEIDHEIDRGREILEGAFRAAGPARHAYVAPSLGNFCVLCELSERSPIHHGGALPRDREGEARCTCGHPRSAHRREGNLSSVCQWISAGRLCDCTVYTIPMSSSP